MREIKTSPPVRCALWKAESLPEAMEAIRFERLKDYLDSSHAERALLRCKECGQLYFYAWYEVPHFPTGHDGQYRTFIPVDDEASADALNEMGSSELNQFRAIHRIHLPGSENYDDPPFWSCDPRADEGDRLSNP